jgi:hypothetical protein
MYDPDRKQWYITGSMYHADMSYWDVQGIDNVSVFLPRKVLGQGLISPRCIFSRNPLTS